MQPSKLPGIYINILGRRYRVKEERPVNPTVAYLISSSDEYGNVQLSMSAGYTLTTTDNGVGDVTLATIGCALYSNNENGNVTLGVK